MNLNYPLIVELPTAGAALAALGTVDALVEGVHALLPFAGDVYPDYISEIVAPQFSSIQKGGDFAHEVSGVVMYALLVSADSVVVVLSAVQVPYYHKKPAQ